MKSLIAVLVLLATNLAMAEVVVIVHPSNAAVVSGDDISRIFLGKKSSFPNGSDATPYYLAAGDPIREAFEEKALGKTSSQLKAYWSKLIFTGKGTPPPETANSDAAVAKVAADPSAIAYVDSGAVTGAVKVALTLP